MPIRDGDRARSPGLAAPSVQDQVLRNQTVGRTCRTSAASPAFVAVTRISTSSGAALAWLTSTIQKPWSKTPVSSSSYSGASLPLRPFSATRSV